MCMHNHPWVFLKFVDSPCLTWQGRSIFNAKYLLGIPPSHYASLQGGCQWIHLSVALRLDIHATRTILAQSEMTRMRFWMWWSLHVLSPEWLTNFCKCHKHKQNAHHCDQRRFCTVLKPCKSTDVAQQKSKTKKNTWIYTRKHRILEHGFRSDNWN